MAKQISLTFKEDAREIELYNWLQSKVSKGAFIKEQLLVAMQNEKNGYVHTLKHHDVSKVAANEVVKELIEEETKIDDNGFGFN